MSEDPYLSDRLEEMEYRSKIEKLYQTRRLTGDVQLLPANASDERDVLVAHKSILALASQYFLDLFTKIKTEPKVDEDTPQCPSSTSKFDIPIDKVILEIVLRGIYLGQYLITLDMWERLVVASKLLKLDKLTQKCYDFLNAQGVTKEVWLLPFRLAHEHVKSEEMLGRVYGFLKKNSTEIYDTQDFVQLKFQELKMLVNAGVWANPIDLQKAKMQWFAHDKQLRNLYLDNLAKLNLPNVESSTNPQDKCNEIPLQDLPIDNSVQPAAPAPNGQSPIHPQPSTSQFDHQETPDPPNGNIESEEIQIIDQNPPESSFIPVDPLEMPSREMQELQSRMSGVKRKINDKDLTESALVKATNENNGISGDSKTPKRTRKLPGNDLTEEDTDSIYWSECSMNEPKTRDYDSDSTDSSDVESSCSGGEDDSSDEDDNSKNDNQELLEGHNPVGEHLMDDLVNLDLPKVGSTSNPQDKSNENPPKDLPVDNPVQPTAPNGQSPIHPLPSTSSASEFHQETRRDPQSGNIEPEEIQIIDQNPPESSFIQMELLEMPLLERQGSQSGIPSVKRKINDKDLTESALVEASNGNNSISVGRKTPKRTRKLPQHDPTEVVIIDDTTDEEADDNFDDNVNKLWCICRKPANNRYMICCDKCEEWFHGKCVSITKAQGKRMEESGEIWICPLCEKKARKEKVKLQNEEREMRARKNPESELIDSSSKIPRALQRLYK